MRPSAFRRILAAWLAFSIMGCASTPPSSFYTLSPIVSAPAERSPAGGALGRDQGDALGVGLGPVTFPVFLDRPQIVTRASPNRLAMDEYQRWGGTLQDDFLRVWSENLALLLGSERILVFPSEVRYPLDFRVAADILAFEGTADGQALLKVRWSVLDADLDRVLSVRETSHRRALTTPEDPEALLAALSGALEDFSREVAVALGALPRPERAPFPPVIDPAPVPHRLSPALP